MKLIFLFLVSVAGSTTLLAQKTVYDANAQVRSVGSFHALQISNAFEVYLSQGSTAAVAVSASEKEDLENIKTVVEGGVLKIRYENGHRRWGSNNKLKAYISVSELDELKASGACEIKISGALHLQSLNLQLSGATDLSGELVIEKTLKADLSGASDITISGSAQLFSIDASGASDVKAYDFAATTCNVEASGASGVRITVDKELSARLSGASNVYYKGAATIRDIRTSGASNISRKS